MIRAKKKLLAWPPNAESHIRPPLCYLWAGLLTPFALFMGHDPAAAQLDVSNAALFYVNQTPSVWTGQGGQYIAFEAGISLDNSPVTPYEITPVVETSAYTANGITGSYGFDPSVDSQPTDQILWYSQYPTNFVSSGNSPLPYYNLPSPGTYNFANPSSPFTLNVYPYTPQNSPLGSPTVVHSLATLSGPGQIPAVQNVTLSGTPAEPTFSWSPPPRIQSGGLRGPDLDR